MNGGAWIRIYGVPIQAWNVEFFKLCVADSGRFMHTDECTSDKGILDFARVLISTPQLELINMATEFIIDGNQYTIKFLEEWGNNLGEDAFLT